MKIAFLLHIKQSRSDYWKNALMCIVLKYNALRKSKKILKLWNSSLFMKVFDSYLKCSCKIVNIEANQQKKTFISTSKGGINGLRHFDSDLKTTTE